ncbi:phospholipid-transporting ATPase [Cryptococcus neoformans C23]|uniref:Phospholipid-transporting ATPase n=1 Tax=Cryptococcus neoformans (strain H99 / ATCC 208821 / CBS 10515 / FGSC 9487) TaxID=235443 RepID=J9VGP8_CRYN9|nr:phospholipid-transporting ATPase [Cryptococcus neoformans var. grubii H99]AUB21956.1 phospholipid-transporting ATPase [Cryptococcus neoformans var. grubii]OWZ47969.1 phospholipid-transporting ATPase [Cryptococcus neoformans var. grubii C23]OWZ58233.1 phospholipid-transporting ATPase [Cryptococcus neoformans var. grubii 125.91]OXG40665.1 phospholipid-transporting ATPase [Cryptococcus neoformans var. grubii Bt15]OXG45329.1 phospholipid-transporting ATPase [Cryptococcus neoformans var. grubii |eukprot:XP_012046288.1 phospholipid-transporting ATPase [Cryptococcus neoformans var. grubii H99]
MPAQQQDPFDDLLGSDSPPTHPDPPSSDPFHEGRHIGLFHQGSSTILAPATPSQRGSSPDLANQPTYALDPFFDDDDEYGPTVSNSYSGYLAPHHSSALHSSQPLGRSDPSLLESSIPLANAGAMPAGFSGPMDDSDAKGYQASSSRDYAAEDPFRDEEGPSAYAFTAPGASSGWTQPRRGRWQIFRDDYLTDVDWSFGVNQLLRRKSKFDGVPREIALNEPEENRLKGFERNSVTTGKYGPITFLPKFLLSEFSRSANLFFLFTACIQQVPNVSPTGHWTTIVPLGVVIIASAFKEIKEDFKRHASDRSLNNNLAQVLVDQQFQLRPWRRLRVGDIVRLEANSFIPADIVLISSSEPEGLCYVETANLDGETNLKIKQAHPSTASLTNPHSVSLLRGHILSEPPNSSLYTYDGTFHLSSPHPGSAPTKTPVGPHQMLLRGAQLRNTGWVYGVIVNAGHETKLMRNATEAPIKRTAVERQVNRQILYLFLLLIVLSLVSTIGSSIRTWLFDKNAWYLRLGDENKNKARQFIEDILTFIILYNNLIPISLIMTMEVVKFQQASLINSDLDMYYAPTDTPALCRTSSLVEELGQIAYIFSDKTGTLTRNEMEFRECTIFGTMYAQTVDDGKRDQGQRTFDALRQRAQENSQEGDIIREFLSLLSICHTVIPEEHDGKMVYQASSPDEAALVAGAEMLGYRFQTRKPKSVFIDVNGETQEWEILNVCEFNSSRKRMSTVVRGPDGTIKLYTKGADTVIFERLAPKQEFSEPTLVHLEDYATEGLRTLCLAYRDISEEEYTSWSALYNNAASQMSGRAEALDKAAEVIEQNLQLLGATAVEDKLQDGVPDAIHTLQQAGIKIWVLTGDRQETAINIGLSSRLISESMNLVIVNTETAVETSELLNKRLFAIKNQRLGGDTEELALIIDGKSLTFALEKDCSDVFLELAIMCKAVICCRVSPLQKALVVKLVKKSTDAPLLAIGDGANDVSMIQAAHVGVGISGVEGLQAARSADVAISQFRFLRKLLLVHGSWSYQRLTKLILFSFYKNITFALTLFWYSWFNDYSGQIAFEGWSMSYYNVIFTILPPLVIGIFDQFVSARMLDRYPQLYHLGQQNYFFTPIRFFYWVGNAFYHSILLFAFSVLVFYNDLLATDGKNSGLWVWGTTLYLAVLLTVLGKAALISDVWTKYTLAAIPGSFIFTMIALPLYAIIAPLLNFSLEYTGIVPRLWGDPVFYFVLLLFPVICLLRDYVWKYYRRTYHPASYHIVQEIQKFSLSDYRPRQEQFQKAIKKVRATQRMRRQRGFAFSQTETNNQDQARLIRAYDTSVARPSGY